MRNIRLYIAALAAMSLVTCGGTREQSESAPDEATLDPKTTLTLTFTYGSEKEAWIKQVTADFNGSGRKIADGRAIHVEAIPMGSGECIEGTHQTDSAAMRRWLRSTAI